MYIILIVLIFVILFNSYIKVREGFDNNDGKIILIGDSIFKNNNYVFPGAAVEDILKKEEDTIVLAMDNARISDVEHQLDMLPNKYNNSLSKVFVSVGGNDILHEYEYKRSTDMKPLTKIFNKYKELVMEIKNKVKGDVILANIYHPFSENFEMFHPHIDIWNEKLKKFANNNKLEILDIDSKIKSPNDLIFDIEPSAYGGDIIAKSILNKINK